MKISIIHNLYRLNPYVSESVRLNLKALRDANIDYQYILFNDNGDIDIEEDIKEFVNFTNVEYIYSDINYGKKMCTGGWVGALKYVKGDIIHNIGQDDFMTPLFYSEAIKAFNDGNWFFTSNGFKVDERLRIMGILIHPNIEIDYFKPYENFKSWFGVINGKVTAANNGMLASGTIYLRKLHDVIGIPNLDEFGGAADFEYWSRILFNNLHGKYLSLPSWYYRISNYSAGNEIIEGKPNRGYWQQEAIKKIQNKYSELLQKSEAA